MAYSYAVVHGVQAGDLADALNVKAEKGFRVVGVTADKNNLSVVLMEKRGGAGRDKKPASISLESPPNSHIEEMLKAPSDLEK